MTEKATVLGGGFFGVNTALELYRKGVDVTLIDRDLNHEYIPGTIDLIRGRFERSELELDLEEFLPEGIELKQSEVEKIIPHQKKVELEEEFHGYENLVVGLGGEPADFGMDTSRAENVWSLDAAENLVEELEYSEKVVVVGGGYVGVEVAGEIAEKGKEVVMLDANTRPISGFTERSSEKILEVLLAKDIEFRGGKKVTSVEEEGVETGEGFVEADTVIWSGGVQASKRVQEDFEAGPKGIEVNEGLSAVEYPDVFVGGDSANTEGVKTAHKAMRQAETVASNVLMRTSRVLRKADSDQKFMLVSIGDTGLLVYRDRALISSRLFRKMKDLVKTYYFSRLKLKKMLS